jgi:hypothetical protein
MDYIPCPWLMQGRQFLCARIGGITQVMGLATSAEIGLAGVAIRATGTVYATAAFLDGSAIWAWGLFALAQFVILYTVGVPTVSNFEELIGYFVTWPMIALGFALIAWLGFWLLNLAELMPWMRFLGGVTHGDFGRRPSGVALILNTLFWLIAAPGADVCFEVFYISIPWLAVLLAVGIPFFIWLIMWAIYRWCWTSNDAMFGSQQTVTRSILFPGIMHVIINLVVSLIVILATDTYNWAWIGSIIVGGLVLIITLVYYFFGHSMWDYGSATSHRAPRTGDMSMYTNKGPASTTLLLPEETVEGPIGFRSAAEMNSVAHRAGIAFSARSSMNTASAVFANVKSD